MLKIRIACLFFYDRSPAYCKQPCFLGNVFSDTLFVFLYLCMAYPKVVRYDSFAVSLPRIELGLLPSDGSVLIHHTPEI